MIQLFGLARVGRDAEVRYMANGDAVANVSLAFNYGRKGEDGKRPTQWAEGALFGKRAEALAPYLTKGTLVTVSIEDAHIETFRKSDQSEGFKLAGRIVAIDLAGGGTQQQAPAQPARQPAAQRPPARQPAAALAAGGFEDMDDDIPF